MNKFTLDATNKSPGRLAAEVAVILMGKNRTDYVRNSFPDVEIVVTNAGQMRFDQKKLTQKRYASHSGYPGSLKLASMKQVIEKKGGKEVLRRAVLGMLPKNKLRPQMIKRVKISD